MVTTTQKVTRRLEKARLQAKKDALYPVSESDSEDERVEWIGQPLNKEVLVPKYSSSARDNDGKSGPSATRRATRGSGLSNIPYYTSFKKGGTTYSIGDIVLVKNEQFGVRKYEVAQILSLWESENRELEGDFRWFHQAEDIEKLRRHQRKGNFPDIIGKHEVVYCLDDDKNDITTVAAKCEVLDESEWKKRFGSGEVKLPKELEGKVWFCQGMVQRMIGYSSIVWKGNQEMMKMKEEKESRPKSAPRDRSESTPATQRSSQITATRSTPLKQPRMAIKRRKQDDSDSENESEFESESEDKDEDDMFSGDERRVKKPQTKKRITVAPAKRKIGKAIVIPRRTKAISAATPRTDYEHARNRLHVKAVPESLPCREDEFYEIQEHLENAIQEGSGSCIYISGVPGTGKTATVHEVIRSLQAKAEEGEISPFQFVEINGMKVTEPSYAHVLLWMALSDQKVTASHAEQLLEKLFNTPGPRRLPCVVLMDELDLMVTAKQSVMYNFFEWPTLPHSRLIVVAVANTMDLPERMLSNKVSSRLGLKRINFQPYTYQQLVTIVESRLEGIKAFRREAIEFAARKVGAVSGDARRALDICRRAVEIVESNTKKAEEQRRKAEQKNPFADHGAVPEPEQVTIRTVDQAIKEMFATPNVRFIQSASLHQKLFLVALTAKLRRLGLAEAEFSDVAHAHIQLCRLSNIEPPMLSDLSAICASLGSSSCLMVESGKKDIHQRVRLSVSEEDVIMALKAEPLFRRVLETLPGASST
ncbi:Origin recognition complex, subunit 1 [Dissophora globulifera]|uniref:Origin recognition complex subunit 1 n=1 Tax=Dissophora globulifera TaxID=979702 RepID=A0A9P6RTU5_9FUNG|nr:Origin recognition complex, subunit 1 [Dissophora globulifera]